MRLSTIIKKIASRKEIQIKPPVLIDIGASGELNSIWKTIAPFSICIAFDADKREFDYIEKSDSVFKKQYVFNKIVVASTDKKTQPFYLTQNPYCSSLLKPDAESLKQFHYSGLFEIKEVLEIDVIELKSALAQLNINYVDWFKTDSQGTDLRLYASLSDEIQKNALVLEFEPGFIDAYIGEDKMVDVLNYMEKKNFFLINFTIKGALRLGKEAFEGLFKSDRMKKVSSHIHNKAPGWAEMVYMNKLDEEMFTAREFMLAWLFATLYNHHDFAFVYAQKGHAKTGDALFVNLKEYSEKKLKNKLFTFSGFARLLNIIIKKYTSDKIPQY